MRKPNLIWNWNFLEQSTQDLRYAITGLRRNPLFASSAIAMLTLGLAAVTVVFSIVDAVLLRPSSFINPDAVTAIEQWHNDRGWSPVPASIYAMLRQRHDLFQEVIAERRGMLTITHVTVPDQMFGQTVTGNLFSQLPVRPLYGRTLQPSDDSVSAPPVILLSYHAWRQLFAADPGVVGKSAQVDGRATVVVGVMPESFIMPGRAADLWQPLRLTSADLSGEDSPWLETLALLKPGLSLKAAQSAVTALAAALNKGSQPDHEKVLLRATAWQAENRPARNIILWLALGTVIGLLAIGCANVSSLLLARGLSRKRDYAIRIATGASQGRLIRQSFLEALLLSFAGLLLGLAFSAGIVHFLRQSLNATALGIPDIAHAQIDLRMVVFSFAVASVAAFLSAGLPSWSIASLALSEGLRESGTHSATGRRVRRLMLGLTGIQAGICMTLLLVSGLLINSLMRLKYSDHGIQADHVLTMRLPFGSWLPAARTPEQRLKQTRRYLNLLDRVRSVNGVTSAALSSSLPLSNVNVSTHLQTPSETARTDSPLMLIRTVAVTQDYFRAMGIPLVQGQSFRPSIGSSQSKVLIVNQSFADRFFHGANVVGRSLRGEDGGDAGQIIGVVRNTAQLDLDAPPEPELFISFDQTLLTPFLTGLVVRTSAAPETITAALRTVISQADPLQPVVKVRTLKSLISDNIALSQSSAWIISAFALVALVLSSTGIYGVVSFATLARHQDFGIRLCLGSTRGGIFRLAVVQALVPIFFGVLAGVVAAWFFERALASVLYKTAALDIAPTVISVLVLISAAFAAAAIPALRSAHLDPARTLRND